MFSVVKINLIFQLLISLWKKVEEFGRKWKKNVYFCINRHSIKEKKTMAKFIGEYSVKIDDKGRMIFPSAFKSVFSPDEKMALVVKKDLFENCLEMYTYSQWEIESNEVKQRLNFFKKEHANFWREYMRDRAVVEPDEKLGRITIPKKILESIGAEKEMIFVGNDHKIEIWAKELYNKKQMESEDFIALAQSILG